MLQYSTFCIQLQFAQDLQLFATYVHETTRKLLMVSCTTGTQHIIVFVVMMYAMAYYYKQIASKRD